MCVPTGSPSISTDKGGNMIKRAALAVNLIIVILEIIALIHDCAAFGVGLFRWYTIDSNLLQLLVSALVVYSCLKGRELAGGITVLHFISAVGLTVTFLIAAFVLAPEGGIRYYFIENVAPINHLICPALSVISLVLLEKTEKMPRVIILWPAAASLLYGVICLVLNAAGVLDGPYFFLQVHEQPVSLIAMWFAIIAALCVGLAAIYYKVKWGRKGGFSTDA